MTGPLLPFPSHLPGPGPQEPLEKRENGVTEMGREGGQLPAKSLWKRERFTQIQKQLEAGTVKVTNQCSFLLCVPF